MRFKNPLAAIGEWIGKILDEDSSPPATSAVPATLPAPGAPVPATSDQDDTEDNLVRGRFVPDSEATNGQDALYTSAEAHTERFRKIVDSFDEDKQTALEWAIRKGATVFCYLAPFVVAVPIGMAVGDVFTMPQVVSQVVKGRLVTITVPASPLMSTIWASFAIHLLSVFLEVLVPILGLATSISFKKGFKDRSRIAGAVVTALFFLLVATANSLALYFLMEKGIRITDAVGAVTLLARSFGALILDIGCTVYLVVSGIKSLKKYLTDQRAKIEAVRDVNQVNIELEQTTIKAAIDRQTAIMDMQSKQKRANTWNEIESMQGQAMIDQARRNMLESGERGGYRRSSW